MIKIHKRIWHKGDGTAFCYRYVHRPGWWKFYCGWVQIEFYIPETAS